MESTTSGRPCKIRRRCRFMIPEHSSLSITGMDHVAGQGGSLKVWKENKVLQDLGNFQAGT